MENLEDAIIYVEGEELKVWTAIAGYMETFEDTDGDGVPNVPDYYEGKQGRKVIDNSKNIIDLMKNPNKYAALIIGVVAVVIVLLIAIILLLKKFIKMVVGRTKRK